jgi:hypothetical protein
VPHKAARRAHQERVAMETQKKKQKKKTKQQYKVPITISSWW